MTEPDGADHTKYSDNRSESTEIAYSTRLREKALDNNLKVNVNVSKDNRTLKTVSTKLKQSSKNSAIFKINPSQIFLRKENKEKVTSQKVVKKIAPTLLRTAHVLLNSLLNPVNREYGHKNSVLKRSMESVEKSMENVLSILSQHGDNNDELMDEDITYEDLPMTNSSENDVDIDTQINNNQEKAVFQFEPQENADIHIVSKAIDEARKGSFVQIIADDIDVLVLLTQFYEGLDIVFTKINRGRSSNEIYDVNSFKYPNLKETIAFLHAFSGCDTNCAFYQKTKDTIFKYVAADEDLINRAQIFYQRKINKDDLWKVTLDIDWCLNILNPTDWGWKSVEYKLVPIFTSKPLLPDKFIKKFTCSCKRGCTKKCFCKKMGLRCTQFCKVYKDRDCENSENMLTIQDFDEDKDFEEQIELQLEPELLIQETENHWDTSDFCDSQISLEVDWAETTTEFDDEEEISPCKYQD
ncbi:unnamed protein product [Psylliodes chrysocephalus]|uniref:Uncharacterized protein n=1 Tax=Psylliodes chrysocephalus TaxID=3402493 RepID=A0A9P0CF28_9CUCU|nr:unnamed protein product [Psylliodes chrysocephala]